MHFAFCSYSRLGFRVLTSFAHIPKLESAGVSGSGFRVRVGEVHRKIAPLHRKRI